MAVWNETVALGLSIANVALILVCLGGIILVVAAVMRRHGGRSQELLAVDHDTHAYEAPGVGVVMADGGRPLEQRDWPAREWNSDDEREFEVGE